MTRWYDRILGQGEPRFALHVCPRVIDLPLPIQRFDDPFLPFGKTIINASRGLVSLYVFDVASYLAIGAAGAVALERTIDYLNDEVPCVLHGPFASYDFLKLLDKLAFGADCLTIAAEANVLQLIDQQGRVVGTWHTHEEQIMLTGDDAAFIELRVLGDALVYQHRHDDFQERLRAALEALR